MASEHSLIHQLRQGCGELHADATEMLAARVELAQLELRLASARAKRMGAVVGMGSLAALAGYIVLVQLAAEQVPAFIGWSRQQTLTVVASTLVIAGGLFAWLAVRRFCRKYRHFEQSQLELRADLKAVQDWLDRGKSSV